jgi:uncharacterized protein with HEPN domain
VSRSRDDRLRDILEAIAAVRSTEARLDQAGVGRDERARLSSVVRELAIIGEAVAELPDTDRAAEPDIPWRNIAAIRILLDHHYHRVDARIVWNAVDQDLEQLRAAVERLLDDGD